MMLQCNIGQRGRVARFFLGALLVFIASILFVAGVPDHTLGWRLFNGFFLFLGVFMIFEGAMGWCAVQAFLSKIRR